MTKGAKTRKRKKGEEMYKIPLLIKLKLALPSPFDCPNTKPLLHPTATAPKYSFPRRSLSHRLHAPQAQPLHQTKIQREVKCGCGGHVFWPDMLETSMRVDPMGSGPPGGIEPDSGWGANNQAPTCHSAFIFIPWWIYQYRGNPRVLVIHYDSVKNYINFELERSPTNIAETSLGEWDTPETSLLGGIPPEDHRVSVTAFLTLMVPCTSQMLSAMSQVATVLNKTSDASTFTTQAKNVKTAFNNAFLNAITG
ncbi:hypothetical protein CVT25_001746 [Psilocybe cyanescens]|uniref:alpha-L-rhamnosidase n=1 Tax=Psilocybe cyanescens TaxID=93625 RepID=A0A409XSP1_PSICY|nr:hypothetical protein CVT25_001746 [Psilocybe cyanescens]